MLTAVLYGLAKITFFFSPTVIILNSLWACTAWQTGEVHSAGYKNWSHTWLTCLHLPSLSRETRDLRFGSHQAASRLHRSKAWTRLHLQTVRAQQAIFPAFYKCSTPCHCSLQGLPDPKWCPLQPLSHGSGHPENPLLPETEHAHYTREQEQGPTPLALPGIAVCAPCLRGP